VITCHRVVAEALLLVLEWRLQPDYAALKDISATAQQVEIRLQQFCYWPMQVCCFLFFPNQPIGIASPAWMDQSR